jgi:hypothetical protein
VKVRGRRPALACSSPLRPGGALIWVCVGLAGLVAINLEATARGISKEGDIRVIHEIHLGAITTERHGGPTMPIGRQRDGLSTVKGFKPRTGMGETIDRRDLATRRIGGAEMRRACWTMRKLDLPRLLSRTVSRERDLALGLIASRILTPGSKLATVWGLSPETASSSLGRILGLGVIEEREVYAALDWLGREQDRIERGLARRHLKDGTLVLYDVSSSYVEGRHCELAQHGYSRDRRPDRPQIVYGLLCDRAGRPIAVEVCAGDTGDPGTLASQVEKLKRRFGLRHLVLVCWSATAA